MTEEQVRQIIKEELGIMLKSDRFTFQRDIEISDGRKITLGTGVGTQIGGNVSSKLGFYDATPVDKPNFISDASGQVADLDAEARVKIANILDLLIELGLMRSS